MKREESKEEALISALKQIEERRYESEMLSRGISDVLKIGVVFDGKRVWVSSGNK